jgi:hypothetical protein
MAKKDTFYKVLEGKPVDRFIHFEDCCMVFTPGEHNMGGDVQQNGNVRGEDWFGCSWTQIGNGVLDGATITPGTHRLDDIADFRDVIPTAEQVHSFDWSGYAKEILKDFDREQQVLQCRSLIGFFERLHCLVGFEDALCAFYEDPDSVHDFFAAMLEYKKVVIDCVAEYIKPDILIFDDDYGTSRATFISPEMWREFFPQYWKPLIDYTHSKAMKFELHSCGYVTPLVGDFVELGMDILQPLQTNNDLTELKQQFGDKIIFRLAIFDKMMSSVDQTEEQVRSELWSYYKILAPGGNFIPDLVPIRDRYYEIQAEVQDAFEKEFFAAE